MNLFRRLWRVLSAADAREDYAAAHEDFETILVGPSALGDNWDDLDVADVTFTGVTGATVVAVVIGRDTGEYTLEPEEGSECSDTT